MPLPVPDLDDRSFQDLVNEARRRIPLYCPEWTDHNLSDPGITLIELFAWMTEVLIYRLNKVPEKNYVKFLELLGVRLAPATAASAEVTFRLTAAQETAQWSSPKERRSPRYAQRLRKPSCSLPPKT